MIAEPTDVLTTPSDLPVPEDDGACDHLKGMKFPSVSLASTAGDNVDPSSLDGLSVLFCYPRSGAPGEVIPDEWNAIPGARGCTPQACSYRDASDDFLALGVNHIFGVSTQDTHYQLELKDRVHLPYQLLSDKHHELIKALNLPTLEWKGTTLIKRLTLVIEDGKIIETWYPVFPSDKNAGEVLKWLDSRS